MYRIIKARTNAKIGASNKLIHKYCLLLNFDKKSLVAKIFICFNQDGMFRFIEVCSFTSSTFSICAFFKYNWYHCSGETLRLFVKFPKSSTILDSMILNTNSGFTVPHTKHCPCSAFAWLSAFLK